MYSARSQSRVSGTELLGALEDMLRLLRRLAPVGDLSPTAASVVGRVLREGPRPLTELAHAEGVSQPAMTQLVTRLERDGLLLRSACETDRRVTLVAPTDAGRDVIAQRRATRAAALQSLLDRLDREDAAAIAAAVPAFARLIDTYRPEDDN